jgi:hypothetical protein
MNPDVSKLLADGSSPSQCQNSCSSTKLTTSYFLIGCKTYMLDKMIIFNQHTFVI